VQFVRETDVVLESLRFEDRMTLSNPRHRDNMVRRQQLGTIQFPAGVFIAGRPRDVAGS
jgi:hypothetical protein